MRFSDIELKKYVGKDLSCLLFEKYVGKDLSCLLFEKYVGKDLSYLLLGRDTCSSPNLPY